MNARFRIGNVYEFKAINFFIAEDPLEYVGCTKGKPSRGIPDIFKFKFRSGTPQYLPKHAIENGMVLVVNEWNKYDNMRAILERKIEAALRFAKSYEGLVDGSYEAALDSRGYYKLKKKLGELNGESQNKNS